MKVINLETRDLPDLWFQTLYSLLDNGRIYTIDRGSYAGQKRLEFDYFNALIKYPGTRPLLPYIEPHYGIPNPVDEKYLTGGEGIERSYLEYVMSPVLMPGESYSYGQRATEFKIDFPIDKFNQKEYREILIQDIDELKEKRIIFQKEDNNYYLNQIEFIIWCYKKYGFNNNQMVLQIAKPDDLLLQDPPCWRSALFKIIDGKFNMFIEHRSWNLDSGMPANLAAYQLMKEYIGKELGLDDGEMYISSRGLHLYEYYFENAKKLRGRDDYNF